MVAVCDADLAQATREAAEWDAAAYSDYHDLLADQRVQAVDIMLPHNLHYEVTRAALLAGKDSLVEKPICATAREGAELVGLARDHGRTFTVAENTRFIRAYERAWAMVGDGDLGSVRLIRTFISGSEVRRLADRAVWKGRLDGSCGGTILDAGVHSFYLLKWLAGEIASVQASAAKLVGMSEVDDHAVVGGWTTSGVRFTTEYSFTTEIPWSERCEIYGSGGSLIIDQLVDPPVRWYRGTGDYSGEAVTDVRFEPRWWKRESIVREVEDFADSVLGGRAPMVDPLDSVYAVRVAERAYESVRLGGAAVDVG